MDRTEVTLESKGDDPTGPGDGRLKCACTWPSGPSREVAARSGTEVPFDMLLQEKSLNVLFEIIILSYWLIGRTKNVGLGKL